VLSNIKKEKKNLEAKKKFLKEAKKTTNILLCILAPNL
jgi:hypothetical protein